MHNKEFSKELKNKKIQFETNKPYNTIRCNSGDLNTVDLNTVDLNTGDIPIPDFVKRNLNVD